MRYPHSNTRTDPQTNANTPSHVHSHAGTDPHSCPYRHGHAYTRSRYRQHSHAARQYSHSPGQVVSTGSIQSGVSGFIGHLACGPIVRAGGRQPRFSTWRHARSRHL